MKSTSPQTCVKLAVGLELSTRRKFCHAKTSLEAMKEVICSSSEATPKEENARVLTKQFSNFTQIYIIIRNWICHSLPLHLELPRSSQLNGRSRSTSSWLSAKHECVILGSTYFWKHFAAYDKNVYCLARYPARTRGRRLYS